MCCRDGSVAHLCIQPVGLLHLLCGKHPPEQGDAARPQEMLSKSTDATKFNRAIISLKAQPPLGSLYVCWLCLYPVTAQDPVPMLIIQMQTGGLCIPVSHAVSKSGNQDSLPKPQGHIGKVRPSSCRVTGWMTVPELFQPFPKICTLLARLSDIHYNSQTALPAKCPSVLSQVPLNC